MTVANELKNGSCILPESVLAGSEVLSARKWFKYNDWPTSLKCQSPLAVAQPQKKASCWRTLSPRSHARIGKKTTISLFHFIYLFWCNDSIMGVIAYYSLLGRDKLCPMRNGWQPCIRTQRPSQQFAGSDRNCKPGSQWPPIKAQTGSTGGHNIKAANIHSHPLLYQQPRIGKEGVSCRIAQISSTKYNVCHQCFSSDFAAKHMFAPFCQLSSDWLSHFGKPLKLVGNGKLNFQPISTGIEFLEMTVEPISIKNRNLIRKAGFHFLSYAFYSDSLMSNAVAIICIFVCINMTYRPHICASKIKSVHIRSVAVHYQNHCQHCLWSNSTICLTDPISAFQSRLSAAAFFMPLSIGWLMASVPGLAPAGYISSSSTFQI